MVPNRLPGKRRLARWWLSGGGGPDHVVDRHGFRYDVPDWREPVAFDLSIDGVYEQDSLDFVLAHLSPGSVFVDVGANIGTLALPAAARVGDRGRVIAIEASPRVFPSLERNVARSGLPIDCRFVAATATPGRVPFFVPPDDHFGMGSMAPQFHVGPTEVAGAPLDAILKDADVDAVHLLKIDVEGFERDVLRGAEALLRGPAPPLVLFEFLDWAETRLPGGRPGDAQRLLMSWGFRLWRLGDFDRPDRALTEPIEQGDEMMVAAAVSSRRGDAPAAMSVSTRRAAR
jgi:FkbM family methyltransferase